MHGSLSEKSRFVQTARRLQRLLDGLPFPVAEVDWFNRRIDAELGRRQLVDIDEARNLLRRLQSPLVPEFGRLRLIAHGGSGMVLSGISLRDDRPKGVKIGLKRDKHLYEREFHIQSRLVSPRIIRVEELGTTPHGEPYIIMELIEGITLLDYLQQQLIEGNPFDLDQTLQIAQEACRALSVCHGAGIVHRDVTLVNFILSHGQEVKLGDFGLAVEAVQARKQVWDPTVAVPGYLAPELADGSALPSKRSDVFAMGRLLYQLFTGEVTVMGPHEDVRYPKRHRSGATLPLRLTRLIARALRQDPRQRYASAEPLLEDLTRLIDARTAGL